MKKSKSLLILDSRLKEVGLTIPEDHCFARTYSIPRLGDWSWSAFAVSLESGKRYIVGSSDPLRNIAKIKANLCFSWESSSGGRYINIDDCSHLKNVKERTENKLKRPI